MNGFNCPDCKNWLKQDQVSCFCGWRSKPKEKKSVNCCRKCGDLNAFRCGLDHDPFFLCDPHREEMKANLAEAKEERTAIKQESQDSERDYLQDMADGIIKS